MRKRIVFFSLIAACALGCASTPKTSEPTLHAAEARGFATPKEASDALVSAAAAYDVGALLAILGPDGRDLVTSADPVQDRQRAEAFVAKARERTDIQRDPRDPSRATLAVGDTTWPLPIPLVKDADGKWYFDARAGRAEILARRIGDNELDVLAICRGYVAAEKEYASQIHDDSGVHQYAQRIVSTPGKHDGLAWQNADGSWGGPVGPVVARALEQGYAQHEPFHGYYFRILTGQGPSARLGRLDYVVGGAMIGGFGLVAWPAEYGVTGVQTFIVGYDGTVYQKDLGPQTPAIASAMELYDPDPTWTPTTDDWSAPRP